MNQLDAKLQIFMSFITSDTMKRYSVFLSSSLVLMLWLIDVHAAPGAHIKYDQRFSKRLVYESPDSLNAQTCWLCGLSVD